jgi:ABC-type nitrate/sulfonate/bicarbonate transport system permease component
VRLLFGRLLIVAGLLLVWEALPRLGLVDRDLLPPFSAALLGIVPMLARPAIQADLVTSALEIAAAFAVSIPIGLALGLALGESRRFAQVMDPLVFFLFGIPKSIFLPMFILTMGIGFGQKVAFGVFSTALIVTMSAAAAVRSVPPEHRLVARSYGATRWQVATRVYLPGMLPILLEGCRTALIFAVTAIMLAEVYAARSGFGHRLADWGENFDMTQLLSGVLLVSIAAIVANETMRWLERRCSGWRS